jgi:metal-responsive CopG/Arc/MetJ family transcriptional regulator
LRIVSFKIDNDTLEMIDKYAKRVGKTRSQIIREAVRDFISKKFANSKYMVVEVGRLG